MSKKKWRTADIDKDEAKRKREENEKRQKEKGKDGGTWVKRDGQWIRIV